MAKVVWPNNCFWQWPAGKSCVISFLSLLSSRCDFAWEYAARSGLGSSWMSRCKNDECPSQNTNEPLNTTPRGKGFRYQLIFSSWIQNIWPWTCRCIKDKQELLVGECKENRRRGKEIAWGWAEPGSSWSEGVQNWHLVCLIARARNWRMLSCNVVS